MFCGCQVVDATKASPNIAVCAICSGMPGVLPTINKRAVEFALRLALALNCKISTTSIFARKNYFYPDLPKGYQISQYDHPIATNGLMKIITSNGEKEIRIRRVHLEEDTGKLIHLDERSSEKEAQTLVDLNRAGIPLLEIVTEPDMRSPEEVRLFATNLRSILRYLGINSGDMQKGVLRVEPNISLRILGEAQLGTRTEIKNLNSFRALERSIDYEIARQSKLLINGQTILQETRGWDEINEVTVSQRKKEAEDDYRYFPEPDLPPLIINPAWLNEIQKSLPELPLSRRSRFEIEYSLSQYDAEILTEEKAIADYYEATIQASTNLSPKVIANWIISELFSSLNETGLQIDQIRVTPQYLAQLLTMIETGQINMKTGKEIFTEMFMTGNSAADIVAVKDVGQISDVDTISVMVERVLTENPEQLDAYLAGKETLSHWFFGQVMRISKGRANPQILKQELDRQLSKQTSE